MQGRPVTIRTFDLGGDKLPTLLDRKYSMSANPMLGLRAVRLSIKEQKLFEVQLTAILRASEYGPLKILLPMISSIEQIRQVKQILNRVMVKLKKRNPSFEPYYTAIRSYDRNTSCGTHCRFPRSRS
jgi:phosphotransferase system enzyme I (PtsI)